MTSSPRTKLFVEIMHRHVHLAPVRVAGVAGSGGFSNVGHQ